MKKPTNKYLVNLIKGGIFGLALITTSTVAVAQRGSMTESGKPVAHAGQQPINNLPNPYVTERNFWIAA